MDIISILGLVLGLAVLIMMGFKGWGMIPTSIVGALVVVITNRMDLWEALSTHYGTFMKNYAGDYFLMFFLGTLFGALMGSSGAAKSIACKIVDLMGSKRALLIVVITSAVLSYGGVSFAVVVFTLYPIALVLFKEGNVSKRLFPAALFAGCASFTMVGLPGSPQIQNIMPTEVLGTTAYAAPLNGIVVSCIIFALSMVWLEWNDKRLKAAGIGFVPGRKDDLEAIDISDRTGMLPFGLAVIPILFVVLYIFVMQQVLKDAVTWSTNYIVIQSLALGCLLTNVLSPYGPIDMVVGTLATAIAAFWTMKMPRWYLAAIPPIVMNALLLPPMWAWAEAGAINQVFWAAYGVNLWTFVVGEAVACYVLGTILLKALPRVRYFRPMIPTAHLQ